MRSKTITLKANEKQTVFDEFNITYSSYGHEHSSGTHGEPFAATIGVFVFQLSDKNSSESITIYKGIDQPSAAPQLWKNYSISLIDESENQKVVVLKIVKVPVK